jgi:L-alanine-DL-glutamate epimerase-like enolase superfamily enzyme
MARWAPFRRRQIPELDEGPDYYPWQEGLFLNDPYRVSEGHVTIPAEPGWGAHINPQWLNAALHQRSSL